MVMKTEAIKNFLDKFALPDLAARYNEDMECQVNVGVDGGTRVEGEYKGRKWRGFTDNLTTWKGFRIPYSANTEPTYQDSEINFDLVQHAEGIGLSGWNWKRKVSMWVGYDFDAITGHSDKHSKKLTDPELKDIEEKIRNIPWTTLRRSTSGRGLHLYVFLPEIPTENHTEHAALARSILGTLTGLTGFDFNSKVDACGMILWIWHRKQAGTDGLTLLKKGEILTKIPLNWKDHVPVIGRTKKKSSPAFIGDREAMFQDLSSKRSKIPLDETHEKLIKYLETNNCCWWWSSEFWMLITHTFHLQQAHNELKMRGIFKTNATGSEAPNDHNCFCFPQRNGSWSVRRYTQNVDEAETWSQDSNGWRFCYLNRDPDLALISRVFGAVEHPKGGYVFKHAEEAKDAAEKLGVKGIVLPAWIASRQTILKRHKDGRLVMEIEHTPTDDNMEGWLNEQKKWKRIFESNVIEPHEYEISQYDDVIRHIITPNGSNAGWVIKSEGTWKTEPVEHVRSALLSLGHKPNDVGQIVGGSVLKCWTLINKPFEEEYPIDRQWNRDSIQLRYIPTLDKDSLSYPTWDLILNHLGKNITRAVQANKWCKTNGIITGADYIKCWIASVFQQPMSHLPYLFFYGKQMGGKSILHEALSLLVTHGVVHADRALTDNFNGELANSIICVIEETDISKDRKVYNRLKDWVNAKNIMIRALFTPPYLVPNTTHWVQFANDHKFCPIFGGDTRITVIPVDPLKIDQIIPSHIMFPRLEKEAPDFLAEILGMELPTPAERTNIAILNTGEKQSLEKSNATLLEQFIDEMCFLVPGEMVKLSDFYNEFRTWLGTSEVGEWSKIRMGKELPPTIVKGRLPQTGEFHLGNVSFKEQNGEPDKPKLIVKDDKLVSEDFDLKEQEDSNLKDQENG